MHHKPSRVVPTMYTTMMARSMVDSWCMVRNISRILVVAGETAASSGSQARAISAWLCRPRGPVVRGRCRTGGRWPAGRNEFIGFASPIEPIARKIAQRGQEMQASSYRLKGLAVGHMQLHAATVLACVFLKSGSKGRGPKRRRRAVSHLASVRPARVESIQGAPHSSNGRVVPRPSERLVPSIRHWPG